MRFWETTGERQARYMRYVILAFVCFIVLVVVLISKSSATPKADSEGFITFYQVSFVWNWFGFFPFFCFIGAGILFPYLMITNLNRMYRKYQGKPFTASKWLGPENQRSISPCEYWCLMTLTLVFCTVWFSLILPLCITTIKDGYDSVQALRQGQYMIAEGTVSVLDIQPCEGHHPGDQIEVNGQKFVINYFLIRFGYGKTLAHGGILQKGLYVRLYYTHNDPNNILRIDVKVKEPEKNGS